MARVVPLISRMLTVFPVLFLLLLMQTRTGCAQAESMPGSGVGAVVEVTARSSDSLRITLRVDDYQLLPSPEDGGNYRRIVINGTTTTARPGAPQVPTTGALLAVPTNAGLTVEIVDQEIEILPGIQLPSAPAFGDTGTELPRAPDGQAPGQDSLAGDDQMSEPLPVADLTSAGYLRNQAVAQLQLTPVQIDPLTGDVHIYRRLVVEVRWPEDAYAAAASSMDAAPAYDAMLAATLLNYSPPNHAEAARSAAGAPAHGQSGTETAPLPETHLKITLKEEGLYLLTHADLLAAGFDPAGSSPSGWRMMNQGREVAIHIDDDNDDAFDPGDVVLFYGQSYQDRYTDENVYWLSSGETPGQRLTGRSVEPTGDGSPARSYVQSSHFEEDTAYWQAMPGRHVDRWFWHTRLSPSSHGLAPSRTYMVTLGEVDETAASADVRVMLKGYTRLGHRTRISLNGHEIDNQSWAGQIPFEHRISVSPDLLRAGENRVEVESLETGAIVDQILVNWIEIDYWRRYHADGLLLRFSAPAAGRQRFALTGFDAAHVWIADITRPDAPVLLDGAVRAEGQLIFEDSASASSRYIAQSSHAPLRPVALEAVVPSTWRSSDNGADYIIITHADFHAAAEQIAAHRAAAGFRTAVVDMDALYHEFSHGLFNPEAIPRFLAHASTHWIPPAPLYVLLLGDASQDYKDNLGSGAVNYVPSLNFDSELFGEVSSDNLLVAVNGDDPLPDLFVGRLPAQSPAEADEMIRKLIAYEGLPTDAAWNRRVTLVADPEEALFAETSDVLAETFPYYYTHNRLYDGEPASRNLREAVIDGFNQGSLFVNYMGHGEHFGWGVNSRDGGQIFSVDDLAALTNDQHPAVVVVGNCLNGFFAGPKDEPSLAEALLRHDRGGAVAVWAPSSLGYSGGHRILLEHFYRSIYRDDRTQLGAATTQARIATFGENPFWRELINTYILFGDPLTQVSMPPNFPYVTHAQPAGMQQNVALDQPLELTFSKPVDSASITLTVSVDGQPSALAWTPSWNQAGDMVRFDHEDFQHAGAYSVMVRGTDRVGYAVGPGPILNPVAFRTTEDTRPPRADIRAANHAPDALLTRTPLLLQFDEPVRPAGVRFELDPQVPGVLAWNETHTAATFRHAGLVAGTAYQASLLAAQDSAGNRLPAPVRARFNVIATTDTFLPFVIENP